MQDFALGAAQKTKAFDERWPVKNELIATETADL
jgi:hypothetical protein